MTRSSAGILTGPLASSRLRTHRASRSAIQLFASTSAWALAIITAAFAPSSTWSIRRESRTRRYSERVTHGGELGVMSLGLMQYNQIRTLEVAHG